LGGPGGGIAVAFPEFWQQFPKALEAEGRLLRIRLFPEQFGDPFELQGGEQKTHTFWLSFAPPGAADDLALRWGHSPAPVVPAPALSFPSPGGSPATDSSLS